VLRLREELGPQAPRALQGLPGRAEEDPLERQAAGEVEMRYYVLLITRNGQHLWSGPYHHEGVAQGYANMTFDASAFVVAVPGDPPEHPQ
jgi:hypothetical protein